MSEVSIEITVEITCELIEFVHGRVGGVSIRSSPYFHGTDGHSYSIIGVESKYLGHDGLDPLSSFLLVGVMVLEDVIFDLKI
jgi:hypothetical protein